MRCLILRSYKQNCTPFKLLSCLVPMLHMHASYFRIVPACWLNARVLWPIFTLLLCVPLVFVCLFIYRVMCLLSQVLERLARFDRVLAEPGGSLLLCGPSGTGRRSCMLLLAYMHQLNFFTPKMTRLVIRFSCCSGLAPARPCSGHDRVPNLI